MRGDRAVNAGELTGYDTQIERIARQVAKQETEKIRKLTTNDTAVAIRGAVSLGPRTALGDSDPLELGASADPGDSELAAREDHQHPGPMIQDTSVDVDYAHTINLSNCTVSVTSGVASITPIMSSGGWSGDDATARVRQYMSWGWPIFTWPGYAGDFYILNGPGGTPFAFTSAATLKRISVTGVHDGVGGGTGAIGLTVYHSSAASGNICFAVSSTSMAAGAFALTTTTVANSGKDMFTAGQSPIVMLTYNADGGYRSVNVVLEWDVVISGGIAAGAIADIPTAGLLGAWYYATDTDALYYDNGTSWDHALITQPNGLVVRAPDTKYGPPTTGTYTVGARFTDAACATFVCTDDSPLTWKQVEVGEAQAWSGAGSDDITVAANWNGAALRDGYSVCEPGIGIWIYDGTAERWVDICVTEMPLRTWTPLPLSAPATITAYICPVGTDYDWLLESLTWFVSIVTADSTNYWLVKLVDYAGTTLGTAQTYEAPTFERNHEALGDIIDSSSNDFIAIVAYSPASPSELYLTPSVLARRVRL